MEGLNLKDFDFINDKKKKPKKIYSLDPSCFENKEQNKLISKLIKMIEEQRDEIRELKQTIEDLATKNDILKLEEKIEFLNE
jgi:predicted RNase H-like nuclease (RuvC/YqgF family)